MSKFKIDGEVIEEAIEKLKTLKEDCQATYEKKVPVSEEDKGATHDELILLCDNVQENCLLMGELIVKTLQFLGQSNEFFQISDIKSADIL